MTELIVLDFETTGLDPAKDEVLQVSMVDQDGSVLMNEYCRPERVTSWPDAEKINGISPEQVAGCPAFRALLPRVVELLAGAGQIVAYNVSFERGFLDAYGVQTDRLHWAEDPMQLFAARMGGPRRSLTAAAGYFGITFSAHDALEDVKATLRLYQELTAAPLLERLMERAVPSEEPELSPLRRKRTGCGCSRRWAFAPSPPRPARRWSITACSRTGRSPARWSALKSRRFRRIRGARAAGGGEASAGLRRLSAGDAERRCVQGRRVRRPVQAPGGILCAPGNAVRDKARRRGGAAGVRGEAGRKGGRKIGRQIRGLCGEKDRSARADPEPQRRPGKPLLWAGGGLYRGPRALPGGGRGSGRRAGGKGEVLGLEKYDYLVVGQQEAGLVGASGHSTKELRARSSMRAARPRSGCWMRRPFWRCSGRRERAARQKKKVKMPCENTRENKRLRAKTRD